MKKEKSTYTAPADPRPKLAKELFSYLRTWPKDQFWTFKIKGY